MAIDKLTSQGLAPGAVTVNSIGDNEITAAKLHTTAIQDKLGYTPVSPTELNDGLSAKANITDVDAALQTKVSKTSDTGSALIPVGSTAERDATPESGLFRFNTTTNSFEGYNGSLWGAVGGGATGGGNDKVFYLNDNIITQSYTIPVNQNATTAGPITLQDGVIITVSDGSVWTIV